MAEKVIRWDYADGSVPFSRYYVVPDSDFGPDDKKGITIIDVPRDNLPKNRIRIIQDSVNSYTLGRIESGKEWHALWGTLLPEGYRGEADIGPGILEELRKKYDQLNGTEDRLHGIFTGALSGAELKSTKQ